jgi:hypothetical protein
MHTDQALTDVDESSAARAERAATSFRPHGGIWIHSHGNAEQLLKKRANGRAWKELLEVASRLPLIRYSGKSEKNPSLVYLQTCMNRMLDYVFGLQYGWSRQVNMPGGFARNNVDFYKRFALTCGSGWKWSLATPRAATPT